MVGETQANRCVMSCPRRKVGAGGVYHGVVALSTVGGDWIHRSVKNQLGKQYGR